MREFDEAIYGVLEPDAQLQDDAPGGVHRRVAPLDTETPFVVWRQFAPDEDKYTLAGLAFRWLNYEVAAVDISESSADAHTALERAEALVQEQAAAFSMPNWAVSSIRRRQESDGHFFDQGGRLWQTVATQYRVMVVPT